jgi:hypothetical protein
MKKLLLLIALFGSFNFLTAADCSDAQKRFVTETTAWALCNSQNVFTRSIDCDKFKIAMENAKKDFAICITETLKNK